MPQIKTMLKSVKRVADQSIKKLRRTFLLRNHDFSIIANNCWGGSVYQYYGMEYHSPTVGLYFFAEEYMRFLGDLRRYLSMELQFIPPESSKYYGQYKNLPINYPIGLLGDVEIVFLHYKSEAEAKQKWERRAKRVNFDNLLVKFNDQNGTTAAMIDTFADMPFDNKVCFVADPDIRLDCVILYEDCVGMESVDDDVVGKRFRQYLNVTAFLNRMKRK